MSDDLISRNILVQAVCKNPAMSCSDLCSLIIDAPVAYDLDKVINKLQDFSRITHRIATDTAVRIVKSGGIHN